MRGSYVSCSIVGRWPSRAASRSHIDVCGSIGPMERYSAIPSINHSGGFTLTSVWTPAPMRPRLNTSYWNWCTISYAELEHVIGHEMVHQFQYDVFSRGRIGAGPYGA